jgi:hypothetical protein
MAFVHTTPKKAASFASKKDFLHKKRSNSAVTLAFDQNCLDQDYVYLKGEGGSYYWMDSKGLKIHLCDIAGPEDISPDDINSIITAVLSSVSSFDRSYVYAFSEELTLTIRKAFIENISESAVDVMMGWKSIAMLILAPAYPVKGGIGVKIGHEEYKIFS